MNSILVIVQALFEEARVKLEVHYTSTDTAPYRAHGCAVGQVKKGENGDLQTEKENDACSTGSVPRSCEWETKIGSHNITLSYPSLRGCSGSRRLSLYVDKTSRASMS